MVIGPSRLLSTIFRINSRTASRVALGQILVGKKTCARPFKAVRRRGFGEPGGRQIAIFWARPALFPSPQFLRPFRPWFNGVNMCDQCGA
jgi:hypothetical protein